jgi:hypothetical protein
MTTDVLPITGHDEARRRRSLIFLVLAVGLAGFTMAIQMGLNANFLREDIGVTGRQMGNIEAVRETCGIVAFAVLAMMAGLAEPLVGAAMLMLLAAGLTAYAFVHEYVWVVLLSLVWSQGLHVWMPLPQSMALALARPGQAGRRLGQVTAAGSAGFGAGLAAAYLLVRLGVTIRPLYLLAGAAAVMAAGACLGIHRDVKTPGPRFVFRRRYALYYLLQFLEGWRKQIFLAFSGFLLVSRHGTPLETMLILWLAIQAIGYFSSPRVGRLIDRVGERRVLVFYFSCLTCFFVGYALIDTTWILYVLFVADSAYFVFAMALTTYVNRIAPPSEHTPTLSMGVAMNHVAAVIMPFVGGLLWTVDYRLTFLAGALAAVLSIPVALRVPRHVPAAETPAGGGAGA